ncbi:MAG: glycosyl hydrolase 108 family protein [Bacteroidales bacterium]|nr:glycosyl hydrolase 108 family protein [Bacteroidales bacterium]
MAQFQEAFEKVMKNEGGYVNDPQDPGGETYKGIARSRNSKWEGWIRIDICKGQSGFPANLERDTVLQKQIVGFYETNYWDTISADGIANQQVAETIFDFGVNAGVKVSATLAQQVVEATADGVIGPKTIEKLNAFDADHFLAAFTVLKIARYVSIVKRRPESRKYFYGWVCRALE